MFEEHTGIFAEQTRRSDGRRSRVGTTLPIRELAYREQAGICHYCKRFVPNLRGWTIDHKTPKAKGGTERPDNKVGCCSCCNACKGTMNEAEFLALLERVSHRIEAP